MICIRMIIMLNIEIRIRKMIIMKENDWEKIMMMRKPVDCPKNK